jgi:tetratricopeptide (TPR) repeat protein
VEYNPRLAQAQSNLGEALRWNGKWEESESSLRKSIDLNASLSESHKNLAVVLLLRGKHSEAEAAARKASELAPTDAESLGLLGSILERRGDLEAALDRFKAAARCDPADQFTYRFEIARLNGNPSRAEDLNRLLEEEIERHPKWSAAQKRTCKTQAAIAAVRCACKPLSDSTASDRRGFRQLAAKLFAAILCEFSSALESSTADAQLEAVSATANWLGDKELAPIRNLLQLLTLPPDESSEWATIWSNVRILRTKLLRPQ